MAHEDAKKGGVKGPVEQGKSVLPTGDIKNVQGDQGFGGKGSK